MVAVNPDGAELNEQPAATVQLDQVGGDADQQVLAARDLQDSGNNVHVHYLAHQQKWMVIYTSILIQ